MKVCWATLKSWMSTNCVSENDTETNSGKKTQNWLSETQKQVFLMAVISKLLLDDKLPGDGFC